ncbi:META domain-containing protein [Alcanivorax sp. NBRC 102024]|jgi:heat shock protein HslJ|uniref:META domain-containing protein n=1 Tax=Alcanivorax sp. NBRC 102024 TaxID=1113895 RepID=UPI000A7BEFED|nr:META domain-containing protein [Alcanivorax sp. NBRC 102024]
MQTLKLSLLAGAALTLAACSSHPTGTDTMVTSEQLQGSAWQVQRLNGDHVGDALITLNFHEPGRLAGKAACNNYMASYTLDEDTFTVKTGGVTMMACPQPLMTLEQQFLTALEEVTAGDINEDGQLVLRGADQVQIEATRQP